MKEIPSFEIKFINHHNVLVRKIIYPVIFQISKDITPISKEDRIKETLFMDIDLFLRECSYDNVRKIVNSSLKYL